MSDRPMRLKYLTKMKIILCIFLLYITAVSVFGQSVELNGIVGKSIEFPAAVKIDGSWMYSGVTIGDMISGRFMLPRNVEYRDRVQWDSSTGFLSLSAMRLEDSGVYTVQNTQQNINTTFQLNVYKDNVPVLKPHVSVTHDEYPCTLLCTVERGTGVTLTLYKNGEKNPYVTSPVENLHLPQTVESGTYTCEAKNSVSRETSDPLTVGAHCTAGLSTGIKVVISIAVIAVVAALTACFFALKYRRTKRKRRDTTSKFEVTRSELEVTRSELEVTRSELEDTRSKLEVTRSELEVTRSKLEDTTSKFEVTRSELEDTRSTLEVTRSELEDTRSTLEGKPILAPDALMYRIKKITPPCRPILPN